MNIVVRCAECECIPSECKIDDFLIDQQMCVNCLKRDGCCCLAIHVAKERECCRNNTPEGHCDRHELDWGRTININKSTPSSSHPQKEAKSIGRGAFFFHAKNLFAAALGIEVLCIAAAEIGENSGLYFFGFNPLGIAIAYVLGYTLAGFTTFTTILGRYDKHHDENSIDKKRIDSCCSVLEQDANQGFLSNLKRTFTDFALGLRRLFRISKQQKLKIILKDSLFILVTAESACILTAETIDLLFYQYSILLSVPLALVAGACVVVVQAAYTKSRPS